MNTATYYRNFSAGREVDLHFNSVASGTMGRW